MQTKALEYARFIVIENTTVAFELLDEYAPEHLIIASDNDTCRKRSNAEVFFLDIIRRKEEIMYLVPKPYFTNEWLCKSICKLCEEAL